MGCFVAVKISPATRKIKQQRIPRSRNANKQQKSAGIRLFLLPPRTRRIVPFAHLAQFAARRFARFRRPRTARVEYAPARRVNRRGQITFQQNALAIVTRVNRRHSRHQRPRIRVLRMVEHLVRVALFHQVTRYITPTRSEMYRMTLMSCATNRYVSPRLRCNSFSRLIICD